jgi:rubrerythrin
VLENVWAGSVPEDGYVQLYGAEEAAEGAFRCAECGYGVVVTSALPACPMCAGRAWEPG